MPLLHQPPTLVTLALTTIARNFEYLVYGVKEKKDMAKILEDDSYLQFQGPFQHMPSSILEKALSVIQEDSSIRHVQTRHLHVLMQPQLQTFLLTFGSGDVHKALELMQTRCPRLVRLNISYLRSIHPPLLLKLPPNLTRLVTLDLSSTETTDSVLSSIGLHCTALKELNVSNCPVSHQALTKLFWDSRRRVKMCNLVTSVNLTGCQVSPATIREGLQLQPTIKYAEFENNLLALDPLYGGIWEDELIFSILSLTATNVDISDVTMDIVVTSCPFVTSFSLHACTVSNDALLTAMAWQNLTQLRLTNTEEETIHFTESVLPILTARGEQLTALLLSRFTYVDICTLGVACPALENLALSNVALYEPVTSGASRDLFRSLQALEVWSDLSNTTLSSAALRCLLRSCSGLRNLLVSGAQQFSDDLLAEAWAENPMPELCRVTVDSCPGFSFMSLYQMFDMPNDINFVRVWNCPKVTKAHEADVFAKIKHGNMDVFFEWFGWTG